MNKTKSEFFRKKNANTIDYDTNYRTKNLASLKKFPNSRTQIFNFSPGQSVFNVYIDRGVKPDTDKDKEMRVVLKKFSKISEKKKIPPLRNKQRAVSLCSINKKNNRDDIMNNLGIVYYNFRRKKNSSREICSDSTVFITFVCSSFIFSFDFFSSSI